MASEKWKHTKRLGRYCACNIVYGGTTAGLREVLRAPETSAPASGYTSIRTRVLNIVCKCCHCGIREVGFSRLSGNMLLL